MIKQLRSLQIKVFFPVILHMRHLKEAAQHKVGDKSIHYHAAEPHDLGITASQTKS